jgi:chaperonin GroEL (HSP60 family)
MEIFNQLAERIIKEQENIIGPIAFEQARKVSGLNIDEKSHAVDIQGNKKEVLENLVKQYEALFGRTSVEVCKDAVKDIISQAPKDQVPQVLL